VAVVFDQAILDSRHREIRLSRLSSTATEQISKELRESRPHEDLGPGSSEGIGDPGQPFGFGVPEARRNVSCFEKISEKLWENRLAKHRHHRTD
jgi:hypothetical protein